MLKFVFLGILLFFQSAAAQDPRVGSWTLVSAHSSEDPPNTLSITALPDGVQVTMAGETHLDFSAKWNAHNTAVPSNPAFNQIEIHRINKRQVQVHEKKNGADVATLRDQLSPDGKELTITTVTEGHPDQITVWTRSGGAKVAKDPFAGEWTEDLSKTRMRQGLTLNIEPQGNSIHFSGDFSYVGRFDGKQYDVRNSRNDTVQLALVDPHTVDAVYRRDNQVSQKDRWVVSADGKTMTLDTNSTLETGQRLTEKLVFQKK